MAPVPNALLEELCREASQSLDDIAERAGRYAERTLRLFQIGIALLAGVAALIGFVVDRLGSTVPIGFVLFVSLGASAHIVSFFNLFQAYLPEGPRRYLARRLPTSWLLEESYNERFLDEHRLKKIARLDALASTNLRTLDRVLVSQTKGARQLLFGALFYASAILILLHIVIRGSAA